MAGGDIDAADPLQLFLAAAAGKLFFSGETLRLSHKRRRIGFRKDISPQPDWIRIIDFFGKRYPADFSGVALSTYTSSASRCTEKQELPVAVFGMCKGRVMASLCHAIVGMSTSKICPLLPPKERGDAPVRELPPDADAARQQRWSRAYR
jgi:hypothetical protein